MSFYFKICKILFQHNVYEIILKSYGKEGMRKVMVETKLTTLIVEINCYMNMRM